MIKNNLFLVLFFCLVISIPLLGDLLGLARYEVLEENRNIGSGQTLSRKDQVFQYVKNFDSKFWGREYLVSSYIGLKKDVFRISPLPEKVILGKGGWLFLADYGAMADYRNLNPFSSEQLDSIQNYLSGIAEALADKNKRFYVVIVPDKHTIYPEYLPENIKKINPVSRLQLLTERMKSVSTFRFLDLTDTLLSAKKKNQVYFKEESHWNDRGAFVGYQYVMNAVQKDFPEIRRITEKDCKVFIGEEADIDLMKLLGKSITYAERTVQIVPVLIDSVDTVPTGITIPSAKRLNPNYSFCKINHRIDGKSLIVFRDSFFSSMIPFVEQSFSSSSFIWTNDIDLDYVISESASVVILEIAERHIDLLMR